MARPFALDDLLANESFGRILADPSGRWLVIERRVPFASAARFEIDAMDELRDRLFLVDLDHPASARPLLDLPSGVATVAYGFSPHGTRLAIARLDGRRWELGVVTMATGRVRWLGISPDYSAFRSTFGWVSDDRLVTIAEPGASPPWLLRVNHQDEENLTHLWAVKETGRDPTMTAVGSGHLLSVTAAPPLTSLLDVDVVSGRSRLLAEGNLHSAEVAPDGRHVALVEQTDRIQPSPVGPLQAATDQWRRRLSIIDVADGGRWQPCPACDHDFWAPVWSPSGRRLLTATRRPGQDWSQAVPWSIDVDRHRGRPIALGGLHPIVSGLPIDFAAIALGWAGERAMIFARSGDGDDARADWYRLGSHPVALTHAVRQPTSRLAVVGHDTFLFGDGAAWRLGQRGVSPTLLGRDGLANVPSVASIQGVVPPSIALLGWQTSPVGTRLDVRDANGATASWNLTGSVQPVAAASGQWIAFQRRSGRGVGDLVVERRAAPPIVVATINARLADVPPVVPVPIHYHLPGGQAATGWLYLPPDRAGRKIPLIVIPYPTRSFDDTPLPFFDPDQGALFTSVPALVGHGYAVLLPTLPLLPSSNRAAFLLAAEVLSAVDAVLVRGEVDPQRLGLWGHSFGGYAAAVIAAQTDRFRAIVASSGIYDLASYRGTFVPWTRLHPEIAQSMTTLAGWSETGQPGLGTTPWSDPARYTVNSPVFHADQIDTPMLIVAADKDFVPLQQGEELFSALYRQGKDAELLSYWGEEHVLMSPANVRDLYTRIFAWFDGHFDMASAPGTGS